MFSRPPLKLSSILGLLAAAADNNLIERGALPQHRGSAMTAYRCYFIRNKHIVGVDVVESETDAAAVAAGLTKLQARPECTGIEVWDGARQIHQAPAKIA